VIVEGILDVHLVTNEDIRNNTSWASHITSRYGTARKIQLSPSD